jgi:hypothetical protein
MSGIGSTTWEETSIAQSGAEIKAAAFGIGQICNLILSR